MKFGKSNWRTFDEGLCKEWVVTNGLGGYAGSSVIGANSRKNQGLLIASLHPPVKRALILSQIQEEIVIGKKSIPIYASRQPGWTVDGHLHLQRFIYEELPEYYYQVEDILISKHIALEYGKNTSAIGYEIRNGHRECRFKLTPLFNYRDHSEVSERADLKFDCCQEGDSLRLVPHKNRDVVIKLFTSHGKFIMRDDIYERDMEYVKEIETGSSAIDNHFKPYDIVIDVKPFETIDISVVCTIEEEKPRPAFEIIRSYRQRIGQLVEKSGLDDPLAKSLVRAADQFIAYRKSTGLKTILAGFPWFADWGRDTMIALTGLTLCTKQFDACAEILRTFAYYVKKGLVPNMFPDEGSDPIYNTVDASLWYFYAVDRYLKYTGKDDNYEFIRKDIYPRLKEIIQFYRDGTDFSIYMDNDGLIHAGSGLDQVTWMDVRVGDWVVTPRHGKPVEINALWYNALRIMEYLAQKFGEDGKPYSKLSEKVKYSFNQKFWNPELNCLYDVVDSNDDKIRPNQIYAVSLPYPLLDREKEKAVVQTVFTHLYATYGLRSLSPYDKEYKGIYKGRLIDRDGAYHQGTAWAFLLGAFITAYTRVHDYSEESILIARRLLEPIEDHLYEGCVGTISEIFDGDEPVIPRGCYAQAWSVGEILRAYVEDIINQGQMFR